jgi:hypothetical protein
VLCCAVQAARLLYHYGMRAVGAGGNAAPAVLSPQPRLAVLPGAVSAEMWDALRPRLHIHPTCRMGAAVRCVLACVACRRRLSSIMVAFDCRRCVTGWQLTQRADTLFVLC